VRALPLILGSLLALIAVGTLAHGITVSVHRRRRELAIYRAVGCTQGQIRAIMAWMATTVAVAAIAIGVPAGVVIGRTAWRLTAESIALTSPPRWPWSAIALVALGTTISANAIAALPWVQRSDTVRSLRAE
jgi:putative ABC transport system permease protein